ncbi:uncharacterized protein EAE97_004925 [Botrytis byssoidea]|uniref:Uncharacterized protein n=1 Tax=Botrytis byssoidea TaxID=139641 RepID=A0A9P5IQ63_9HELO|nr:uncharacterized protein EAE97_004925 [Botrytis byssoidea]KAF7945887.1 hypothetical protein EAE97_004925 [Botrytis byssoidea]
MVFSNVGEIMQHAFEHAKPIIPADSVPPKEADSKKATMDHHKLKYGQNTCKRCGGMFLKRIDLENYLAHDHGLQLECSKPDCHHKATTPLGFALHYLSCSMVKCKKCEGSFDKDKDPELKAHMAESHSTKLIFGCVQRTRTFQSSDAVAQHYSAEHAFICAACPGTFFINSATRERHFATCGSTSETSDSGESFQTSRTGFLPLMQMKPLPVLKICPPSTQAQVQIHEEPFSPALLLPLTQSTSSDPRRAFLSSPATATDPKHSRP